MDFIRQSYRDDRLEDLSLMMPPEWTREKQVQVDQDLSDAVQHALDCSLLAVGGELRVTFSGSVAVDRAITACLERSRAQGAARLEVVSTSPSIDIIRDFLDERSDVDVRFVDCLAGAEFPHLNLDGLLDALRAPLATDRRRAALLTSPENPTGECWSRTELKQILEACSSGGHTLILDHCFLLAGVQQEAVAAVWDIASPETDWLGIWDTGKTFGLNGDKLGFLISSPSLSPFVDDVLRVLQFDVSRRQKLFFAELLRFSSYYDYMNHLRATCRTNLDLLTNALSGSDFQVLVPQAGSLALIELPAGYEDARVCADLLSRGLGTVRGSTFFHGDARRNDLLRVALARDPAMFADAVDLLARCLRETQPSIDGPAGLSVEV